MSLYGSDGRAVAAEKKPCPTCKDMRQKRQLVKGFGGFWGVACLACGAEIEAGRGDPPVEGEY